MRAHTRIDPAVRRQLILDEAIQLVSQLGYHGLTVQALAKCCGLTNGGLLHYFGSKELLLVAVLEERDRREAEIIAAEVQSAGEGESEGGYSRSTLLRMFRAIAARSVAQPELVRLLNVLQLEALHEQHPAHDYFTRRQAMVVGEFATALAGNVAEPVATARAVLALLDGLFQQWLRANRSFDLLEAWDIAAAALIPSRRFRSANSAGVGKVRHRRRMRVNQTR